LNHGSIMLLPSSSEY